MGTPHEAIFCLWINDRIFTLRFESSNIVILTKLERKTQVYN